MNGSQSKFLPKSEISAYVPKSSQALKPRSARIAMNKLSRSRRPRSQRGSKTSRNAELDCRDRSDRAVAQTGLTGLAGNSNCRPVRPVAQTGQTGCSETARQQSSKCQISSKRSPNPTKLGGKLRTYPREHIQKRSFPKD